MPKRKAKPSSQPDRKAVAQRWRAFRESVGATQEEWAQVLHSSRTRVSQLDGSKVALTVDDLLLVLQRFPQLNVTALITGSVPSDYPSAAFQYFLADMARVADAMGPQDSKVLTVWRHDHAQLLHLYEALKGRGLKPSDPGARELVTMTLRGLMSST